MSKRITIMIDDKLLQNTRNLQAKIIPTTKGMVSLSGVIGMLLSEALNKDPDFYVRQYNSS